MSKRNQKRFFLKQVTFIYILSYIHVVHLLFLSVYVYVCCKVSLLQEVVKLEDSAFSGLIDSKITEISNVLNTSYRFIAKVCFYVIYVMYVMYVMCVMYVMYVM